MTFSQKTFSYAAVLSIIGSVYLSFSVQAEVQIETFPIATSFDQNLGNEIQTDLTEVNFLNVLDSNNDRQPELLAIDSDAKGAIIVKQADNYRSFKGLEWERIPQGQIIGDITADNLPDIISLLPAQKSSSKEWHYGKITAVSSDKFKIDISLRKNILAQSTIIGPNGKQYQVAKNNGPQDETDPDFIFLAKSLEPDAGVSLPNYSTFLAVNQFIAYLLPVEMAVSTPSIVIHKNMGNHNFVEGACTPHIPADITTVTSLVLGDINNDRKKDFALLTHPREQLNSSHLQTNYNNDSKIFTLTIQVPSNQIRERNLAGSFFSFNKFPQHLFRIRENTSNQITVVIQLTQNAVGLNILQSSMLAGDTFWLTLNDEVSRKAHVYLGDNQGCFTYTNTIKGTVFETSFGRVTLPGANAVSENERTILTDTTTSFLPIDSLVNRSVTILGQSYTIEHNDRHHLFLAPGDGDLRPRVTDALHSRAPSVYEIQESRPTLTLDLTSVDQIMNIYRDVPNGINNLIDNPPLAENATWVRPVDIDQDTDIDLVFIQQKRLFLKLNNERTP